MVRKFSDNRLMLLVFFTEGSNFWIHPDRTCSYVPKKDEIELIRESLDALDTYNALKKNLDSIEKI